MDDWRYGALKRNRVLWEKSLPVDDIITSLLSEGYLSDFQYEEVDVQLNVRLKRRKLIDYFLEKDVAARRYLFHLVEELPGYSHLVGNEDVDATQNEFELAERRLTGIYSLGYPIDSQFVQLLPRRHQRFFELDMTECNPLYDEEANGTSVDATPSIKSLKDLLRQLHGSGKSEVILVEGVAGVGKSALSYAIAQRWADEKDEDARHFKLIILLELKNKEASTINSLETVLKELAVLYDSCDVSELALEISQRKGEGVLFLIDGADECPHLFRKQSRSYLWRLINGRVEECTDSSFVITCRPTIADLRNACTLRIKLLGFSYRVIDELLDEVRAFSVKKWLSKYPVLKILCRVPLYLAIAKECIHDSTQSDTITSPTSLFRAFILSSVSQSVGKTYSSLDDIPDTITALLCEIGKLAYTCVKEGISKFHERDYPEASIRKLKPLKLIYPVSETYYSFSHHLLKEFLAAFYLGKLPPLERNLHIEQDIFSLKYSRANFSMIFRFYAGLYKLDDLKKLFSDHLLTFIKPEYRPYDEKVENKVDWSDKLMNQLAILHGCQEAKNTWLLEELVKRISSPVKDGREARLIISQAILLDSLDYSALSYAMEHSRCSWFLHFVNINVTDDTLGLLCHPQATAKLAELKLTGNVTLVQPEIVDKIIRQSTSLTSLTIGDVKVESLPSSTIASLTETSISKLSIKNSLVSKDAVSRIVDFIIARRDSPLELIELSNCQLSKECKKTLLRAAETTDLRSKLKLTEEESGIPMGSEQPMTVASDLASLADSVDRPTTWTGWFRNTSGRVIGSILGNNRN